MLIIYIYNLLSKFRGFKEKKGTITRRFKLSTQNLIKHLKP